MPPSHLPLPGPLLHPHQLASLLGHPALRVFDATKFLPGEGRDGHTEFLRAHIPTAQFFDIDRFADPDTDLPHMAPSPGRFARLAGHAGIANTSAVVFYDQKGQASAARGWWLMQLFGHPNTALLDGGLPAWREAGLPLGSGAPAPPPPAEFQPGLCALWLAGIGDVTATIAAGGLVLDARPEPRFRGEAPEPRPGLAAGHIPGSRSLPVTTLLDAGGRFLPPDELRARFEAAGATPGRPLVTSCGSGVTAATLSFAACLAGLGEVPVYDGSWAEWGSRTDTPKETGP